MLQPGRIPYKWRAFGTVAVGTLMTTIDSSIVNIALPRIGGAFGAQLTEVGWVSVAYLVTVTGLLLTLGRLADMYGRKVIYTTGFALFTFASGLCALAPTLWFLVVSRVLQAIGGAMMYTNSAAIITDAFPSQERGQALGLNGSIVATGLTIGPTLGGFLIGAWNWRAIFTINLPIGAAGIFLAMRLLKSDAPSRTLQRFDLPGAGLLLTAMMALTVALSQGQEWGWQSVQVLGLLAIAVVCGVAFVTVEARVMQPMIELALFRNRLFAAANASTLIAFWASYISTLLMPFYLLTLLGFSPQHAGLILAAVPLSTLIVAPLSGWLSDRLGSFMLSSGGLAVMGAAFMLLSRLGSAAMDMDVVWRLIVLGVGSGLFQSPNNSAVMGAVSRARLGIASGMLATMRNLGMAVGIAVGGAAFTARQAAYVAQGLEADVAFVGGLHDAYLLATAVCVVGLLASLVRGNGVKKQVPEAQAVER